jgi:NB-ARC domain
MEPKIKDYLESMEGTIKHLKSMGTTSKINQAQASNYVELGLRDRDVEKDGAEKALFPVQCLPAFHTKYFTGRDKEIDSIHERLASTEVNRLQSYLIYGRRGIGKTQIALEYSRRYKESYDAIFWIQCETSASLRTSFAEIAVSLELDGADKNGHFEENLMKVLGWLRRTRKRWLLIYDNAERGQLLKGYWPVGARGSILLTSRTFYNFFEDDQRHGETVPLFNEEERWNLLMAHLGTEWQAQHFAEGNMMVEVEKAAAKTLLDKTGGLPLAITHAASLIKNPKIGNSPGKSDDTSVRGFLEIFRESHGSLPERQSGPREPLFHSLDTIWSIAFKALNPNARALLGVLALLSPDLILIDLFQPSDQERLTEKLAFCRTGSGDLVNRPQIQTVIKPSVELQKAIEELESAAFISRIGREMRIHREVQEAVNYQGAQDLKECFDATVHIVYDAFPKQDGGRPLSDQWDSCRRSIQHAIHLANKYSSYAKERLGAEAPLKNLSSADFLLRLLANCAW